MWCPQSFFVGVGMYRSLERMTFPRREEVGGFWGVIKRLLGIEHATLSLPLWVSHRPQTFSKMSSQDLSSRNINLPPNRSPPCANPLDQSKSRRKASGRTNVRSPKRAIWCRLFKWRMMESVSPVSAPCNTVLYSHAGQIRKTTRSWNKVVQFAYFTPREWFSSQVGCQG